MIHVLNKKEQAIAMKYATIHLTTEIQRLRNTILEGNECEGFDFRKELAQLEMDFNILFDADLFHGVDIETITPEETVSLIESIVLSESLTGEEAIDDLISIVKDKVEVKPKRKRTLL